MIFAVGSRIAATPSHSTENRCKQLLRSGANPNLQNALGGTALMLAAFSGYPDVLKELLDRGSEVNLKAKNGLTALMQAVIKQEAKVLEIVRVLLDKGADVNAQDAEGQTALMLAVDFPPFPPPPPSGARAAARKSYEEDKAKLQNQIAAIELMVSRGANLALKDKYGRTALKIAQANHQPEIAKLLTEKGAF